MSITITNPEGRNVEFKDQRGPTCGLYALSFVLEYLYDIKIPATADGDKTRESLRNKFKKDGKTVIGELYDATRPKSRVSLLPVTSQPSLKR